MTSKMSKIGLDVGQVVCSFYMKTRKLSRSYKRMERKICLFEVGVIHWLIRSIVPTENRGTADSLGQDSIPIQSIW